MSDHFVQLDRRPYVEWWVERFGLPQDTFSGLGIYQRGRSTVWAGVGRIDELAGAQVEAVGIPFLRLGARFWKPTSIAVVTFASGATLNVIDLDGDELRRFLAGEATRLREDDSRRTSLGHGFVVARFRGVAVGCAEWHPDFLYSCIPKGKRVASLDM